MNRPGDWDLVDDTPLVRAIRARRKQIDNWMMTVAVLVVLCINVRALWVIVPREFAGLFQ
ncbi:hypothetical protein [Sphingomonas sp. LaA6.9]|uniref:hypothetical protein n=1 Tax=Sphingomonas sp. LaA6.9 TaxID=2919914 RepID=UPI001F4F8EDA|nr:hypothetical protein [Sphingomonas sp. LaA6.9]MCJ8158829.1 hypothetical protein [Sphingomonas sp. LaA6.9]